MMAPISEPQSPPPRPGRIRKRLLEPDWPDLDRFLWEQAFTKGDMFAAAGAGAHLAAYTVFQLSCTYGTWLAHISRHCPEVLLAHPFHRVNPTRIRDFAEELSATNSTRSVASHLRKLRQVQLKFGTAEKLEWLSTLASRLQASGRARSKEGRVQTADELFKLGLLLMNQATEKWQVEHSVSRAAGRMYRDGLLIAILAIAPIRRRNIAALSLGDNLVLLGDEWHIVFGAAETKNGREYEIGLALLSKEIDRFLAVFRPAFHLSDKHSGFWPSTKRCPMTPNAIYDAICRRTTAHFGRRVNPHLFRDGAATFWALNAPEMLAGASALLGHAGPKTLKHYNQAASIIAGRRLAKLLAQRVPT